MQNTGNYTLYPVIKYNGQEYKKECIYVHNCHFAVQQRLAQNFKSTILQLKKKKKTDKKKWVMKWIQGHRLT